MKQGWQIYKLEDICTIYDKLRKPISKKDRVSGIYPYYGASCVQDYVNDYIFDGRYVLIGEDGAKWGSGEDTAYIVEGKFWVNNHAHIIQCNNGIVDTFIYYYFNHLDLTKLVAGAIIPKLTQETLRSMEIPIPPISEQQRIVALLDAEFAKIDALKANAEKNLQNAKDLFQAALKKLIIGGSKGWKSTKLKTICSKIGSGATPLGGKSTYGKEGVSLIRSLNVHNNEFHYEDLAHINEEQAKQLSNVEIKENDVLFNITGASVTRCCKVPKNVLPARVNQHVSILRLLPYTLLPNFLVYTMISPHHNSALMKMAENGATRQAITKKQLEEWVIKYPETIADQQSIVSRLDTLNEKCKALQANYEKTLSLCDDLKQALLTKAFNGEL